MSDLKNKRKLYIIYTEEEGGDLWAVTKDTNEETKSLFDDAVENRILSFTMGDRIIRIRPCYVCLVETVKDFDFTSGRLHQPFNKEIDQKEV